MAEEKALKKDGTPVKVRKRSARFENAGSRPSVSEFVKARWRDPEYRAKMMAVHRRTHEESKGKPWRYRYGVPDGMRRGQARPLWKRAEELADRFIKIMKDAGELPNEEVVSVQADDGTLVDVTVPNTDAGKAEAALRQAFVLAVGPSHQTVQIQAIKAVLDFTKSKPESKSKLTLGKAEDFLDEVAKDLGRAD